MNLMRASILVVGLVFAVGCSGNGGGSSGSNGAGSSGGSGSTGGTSGAVNFNPSYELVHVNVGHDSSTNTDFVTGASFMVTDFAVTCADFPAGSANLQHLPDLSNHTLTFEVDHEADGGSGQTHLGPGTYPGIGAGSVPPEGNFAQGTMNYNATGYITANGGSVTLSQLDPSGAAGSYTLNMTDGSSAAPVTVSGSLASPTLCP
ncbi:MAG: hypothetical protein JST54_19940 [Deltaproteobacteria bacterium]|nr:hypothetical protein [Deltaproteobacteria bacterium]